MYNPCKNLRVDDCDFREPYYDSIDDDDALADHLLALDQWEDMRRKEDQLNVSIFGDDTMLLIMRYLAPKDLVNLSVLNRKFDMLFKKFLKSQKMTELRVIYDFEHDGNMASHCAMVCALDSKRTIMIDPVIKDMDDLFALIDCVHTLYTCVTMIIRDFCREFKIEENLLMTELNDAFTFRDFNIEIQSDYDNFEFEIVNKDLQWTKRIRDEWLISLEYTGPMNIIDWGHANLDYRFKIFSAMDKELKRFEHSYNKRIFTYVWNKVV